MTPRGKLRNWFQPGQKVARNQPHFFGQQLFDQGVTPERPSDLVWPGIPLQILLCLSSRLQLMSLADPGNLGACVCPEAEQLRNTSEP